jgi:DUF2933 family protein
MHELRTTFVVAFTKRLVFLGFAAIAGFFLWEEHKAHILGVLPYALLLLCPLMHLFHSGHGNHGDGDDEHKDHR